MHKNATATNLLDIDDKPLGELISAVKKITAAVNEGLEPDGIRVMQFNGAPAGQTVYHLHFHVIPIYEGKQLGRHASGGPADAATLEPVAAKIKAALKRKLGF